MAQIPSILRNVDFIDSVLTYEPRMGYMIGSPLEHGNPFQEVCMWIEDVPTRC